MAKTEIGDKLKKLRGKKTIQNVSKDIGISYSALAMYENGYRIPRDEIKIKLAHYYNTTVQDIFYN